MSETADLDNASLTRQAALWRLRALRGERDARGMAHELEAELRRRGASSPARRVELDTRSLEARQRVRPWWGRWSG